MIYRNSIADRELSRHHSTIECDGSRHLSSCSGSSSSRKGDGTGLDRLSSAEHPGGSNGYGEDSEAGSPGERRGRSDYYLCDVGSTNGTYVQVRVYFLFIVFLKKNTPEYEVAVEYCYNFQRKNIPTLRSGPFLFRFEENWNINFQIFKQRTSQRYVQVRFLEFLFWRKIEE